MAHHSRVPIRQNLQLEVGQDLMCNAIVETPWPRHPFKHYVHSLV